MQNAFDPALTVIIENNPTHTEEELIFQRDGALPDKSHNVLDYLNETFPVRWVGPRGANEWLSWTPYFSPLDLFLWGHTKNKVYSTSFDSLRARENDSLPYMMRYYRQCCTMCNNGLKIIYVILCKLADNIYFNDTVSKKLNCVKSHTKNNLSLFKAKQTFYLLLYSAKIYHNY